MHPTTTTIAVVAALLGLAGTQSSSAASSGSGSVSGGSSSPTSQAMPPSATQGFDVSKVDPKTRASYCLAQQNSCRQICDGGAQNNQCDQNTLVFQCTCINGTTPDVSAFVSTIPYFECIETYNQCIANNPNDADAQQKCKDNEKCATATAHNAATESTSATSSSAAASSTAAGTTTSGGASGGSATSAGTSSTSSGSSGSGALVLRPEYGTGIFAAVMLAGLRYLL